VGNAGDRGPPPPTAENVSQNAGAVPGGADANRQPVRLPGPVVVVVAGTVVAVVVGGTVVAGMVVAGTVVAGTVVGGVVVVVVGFGSQVNVSCVGVWAAVCNCGPAQVTTSDSPAAMLIPGPFEAPDRANANAPPPMATSTAAIPTAIHRFGWAICVFDRGSG
jgi:hypothetical protein